MSHGGGVELAVDGSFTSMLRTAQEIPAAKFEVASIYLKSQHDADGSFLVQCQALESLQTLNLFGQPITNESLNGFLGSSGAANLRTLSVMDEKVNNAGLVNLAGLKQLTSLTLRCPQVTDATLRQLESVPLTFVDLALPLDSMIRVCIAP